MAWHLSGIGYWSFNMGSLMPTPPYQSATCKHKHTSASILILVKYEAVAGCHPGYWTLITEPPTLQCRISHKGLSSGQLNSIC